MTVYHLDSEILTSNNMLHIFIILIKSTLTIGTHELTLHCTIISNPKQPSCKKVYCPQEFCCEEKCEVQVAAKKWLWWQEKFLTRTIQVNLYYFLHVLLRFGNWIVVTKVFAFSLPSQPLLGCQFGFHIFFHNSILGDWMTFNLAELSTRWLLK